MDFWLPLIHAPGDDTDQIFETAQTAEAAGFAGIALIDHIVIPTVRTTLHPSGEDRIAEAMPFFDVFTTAAALAVLDGAGLRAIVGHAVAAADRRSAELAAEFGSG